MKLFWHFELERLSSDCYPTAKSHLFTLTVNSNLLSCCHPECHPAVFITKLHYLWATWVSSVSSPAHNNLITNQKTPTAHVHISLWPVTELERVWKVWKAKLSNMQSCWGKFQSKFPQWQWLLLFLSQWGKLDLANVWSGTFNTPQSNQPHLNGKWALSKTPFNFSISSCKIWGLCKSDYVQKHRQTV